MFQRSKLRSAASEIGTACASTRALSEGHEASYRVSLRKPVRLEELSALAGVDHAEALDDGRFRLVFAVDATPDALVERAVQQQWGLQELVPEQQSLEELFIELTRHEEIEAS